MDYDKLAIFAPWVQSVITSSGLPHCMSYSVACKCWWAITNGTTKPSDRFHGRYWVLLEV